MPGQMTRARRARHAVVGVVVTLLLAACSSGSGSGSGAVAGATAPNATSTAACPAPPAASTAPGAAAATLTATQGFLGTLDENQRTTVAGERTPANLAQWSNLPDDLFERAGLRMDALDPVQQAAAFRVLEAALSPEGYTQVRQISTADGVLAATSQMNLGFGADRYWVRILGTPAATGAWTVQYGGHHLAVNVTVVGDAMTLAPTLWGAQPSSYAAAGTSAEPLCGETTRAFALMNALDPGQQQQAILDTPVTEIVLGAQQDGRTLAPEGVSAATFTPGQKQLLLGPAFSIEFAHQQGGGANAGGITHIHSIYREPGNDYGAALGT